MCVERVEQGTQDTNLRGSYVQRSAVDVLITLRTFQELQRTTKFGLQSCFPVFVTSQIVNPAYGNLNG